MTKGKVEGEETAVTYSLTGKILRLRDQTKRANSYRSKMRKWVNSINLPCNNNNMVRVYRVRKRKTVARKMVNEENDIRSNF